MSTSMSSQASSSSTSGLSLAQLSLEEKEPPVAYSQGDCGGVWRVMSAAKDKIVSASYDHLGRLWTTKEIEFADVKVLRGHKREVLSLAKLTEKTFLTGSADGIACVWDNNGKCLDSFREPTNFQSAGFYSMCVLDQETVATGACQRPAKYIGEWKHSIKIWNVITKQVLFSLNGHLGGISAIVSLGRDLIASSSGDSTVRIWNLKSQKTVSIFKKHADYVYGLAILGDGRIVTASRDRTMRIVDVETADQIGEFADHDGKAHESTVYDVNSLNENVTVSGSRDGYVKVWDRRTSGSIRSLSADDGFVYTSNFSPDGKVIAGTSGQCCKTRKDNPKSKKSSAQGKLLNDAHVVVWDLGLK